MLRAKGRALAAAARLATAARLVRARLRQARRCVQHRASPGATCGVRAGRLRLSVWRQSSTTSARSRAMPLTVGRHRDVQRREPRRRGARGRRARRPAQRPSRRYSRRFGLDPADNAGRLMRFDVDGVRSCSTTRTTRTGLRGVMRVAERLRAPAAASACCWATPATASTPTSRNSRVVATEFAPDLVVVKEDEGHLRGRQPGEVPAIIRNALLKAGMRGLARCRSARRKWMPRCLALDWARPGDALVLLDALGRRARRRCSRSSRRAAHADVARRDRIRELRSPTGGPRRVRRLPLHGRRTRRSTDGCV